MSTRLIADCSLDLDNKWAYLRTHGDAGWETLPSYIPYVVPKVLSILADLQQHITFFIVGLDATVAGNLPALHEIAAAGHEVANHSFNHEPWLQRKSQVELREEFERTEDALGSIAKQPLVGFRAPGYSLSGDVLELMCERNYQYDCSTLPTYLGPAARSYYLLKSSFSKKEAEDRQELFGSFSDGFRSLRPYIWATSEGEILEIPVSTMPIFRIPFHFSYLHYIAQMTSKLVAWTYFKTALTLCQWTRTAPSLLLHPLDFLGADEVPELSFFPGMKLSGEAKRAFMQQALRLYSRRFDVRTMQRRAHELLQGKDRMRRVHRLPYRDA